MSQSSSESSRDHRSGSTFKLHLGIGRQIIGVDGKALSREGFCKWLGERFLDSGLLGIHEGTLLSEDAAQLGLETESWTVDAGLAPRERDWVEAQELLHSELFFETREAAQSASRILQAKAIQGLEVGAIEEQPGQDWDASWKASFLGAENGFEIPPFWRVLPPWGKHASDFPMARVLRINPGAGFGTGTHETTRLCLEAIGEVSQVQSLQGRSVLDFGSGSGILAIAAALLGAQVDAVEIDPLAVENAIENAAINGIDARIAFSRELHEAVRSYDLIIANILRPVLLEFSQALVSRMAPQGSLILSGLIDRDVLEVKERFSSLLGGKTPRENAMGEWRSLVWASSSK